MPRGARVAVLGIALVLIAVTSARALESAPTRFNFQGRLTTTAGAPVTAPQTARFSLIQGGTATAAISTGTIVYQEDATITPDSNGVFAHVVGSGTPVGTHTLIEADFITNGQPLFVEASIGGSPILPRTQALSTGYAIEASRLDGKSAAEIIGESGGNAFANMVVRNGAGLEWLSSSSVRVKPGTLGFNDGRVRMNAAAVTWNFANGVGPLGLDAGAEAASTWYYLYAVPDPTDDNTYTAVASTRSPLQVGGLGPAGYGFHRYLGAIRNDGSSNLFGFRKTGMTVNWFTTLGPWLYRPTQPQVTVDAVVAVDASGFVPETGSAVEVTGYYDAWCNAAITWYLGTQGVSLKYFVSDWQNGSSVGNASVPVVNRSFTYYADLHPGWTNDSCQHTGFYYTGYSEDLSNF